MGLVLGSRLDQMQRAEQNQTVFRWIVTGLLFAFVGLMNFYYQKTDKIEPDDLALLITMGLSFLVSTTLVLFRRWQYDLVQERIVLGLVHDVTIATLFLVFFREKMVFMLFVYLWITMGYGFRFGSQYLFVAGLFTSLGLLLLFQMSPTWGKVAPLRFDLALIFAVVASYTGYLLREVRKARDKIEKLAVCDPVTELPNRRIVEEKFPLLIDAARESGEKLGLIYFDLDGFKEVNSAYGHVYGDRLLNRVADLTIRLVGESDIVARMGGDEFLLILKGVQSEEGLRERATALLHSIQSIETIKGKRVRVSASLGCLYIDTDLEREKISARSYLREVDRLMYAAKVAMRKSVSASDRVQTQSRMKKSGPEKVSVSNTASKIAAGLH